VDGARLTLLDAIRVKVSGPGQPRKQPAMLVADKGYAHDPTRRALRRRRIRHIIPERSDRAARGSAGGRPPAFDPSVCRHHNVVERCFNRFKQRRDLATRFARMFGIYHAWLVSSQP
jgi:transposase